jgi:hypothetical protein
MKNLTTLTNVKTLSSKSANKIKGGETSPVIDKLLTAYPVIDKLTVASNTNVNYQIIIK